MAGNLHSFSSETNYHLFRGDSLTPVSEVVTPSPSHSILYLVNFLQAHITIQNHLLHLWLVPPVRVPALASPIHSEIRAQHRVGVQTRLAD